MTSTQAKAILEQYRELHDLAESFTGKWNLRFDEYGNIEDEVNTACHCHPEYEWQVIKTAEEFAEWLDKRASE